MGDACATDTEAMTQMSCEDDVKMTQSQSGEEITFESTVSHRTAPRRAAMPTGRVESPWHHDDPSTVPLD